MPTLSQIVENNDTPAGRCFDAASQITIVASLAALAFETLPDLSDRSRLALKAVEGISLVLFSAEYAARIAAASNRLKYATSF